MVYMRCCKKMSWVIWFYVIDKFLAVHGWSSKQAWLVARENSKKSGILRMSTDCSSTDVYLDRFTASTRTPNTPEDY